MEIHRKSASRTKNVNRSKLRTRKIQRGQSSPGLESSEFSYLHLQRPGAKNSSSTLQAQIYSMPGVRLQPNPANEQPLPPRMELTYEPASHLKPTQPLYYLGPDSSSPVMNLHSLEELTRAKTASPLKRQDAVRGMTNSRAHKYLNINAQLAKYTAQSELSATNAQSVKKLLENKTRKGNIRINPNELNLLKKALKVIAANQQTSPANEPGNASSTLYSSVISKAQRSASVAPAPGAQAAPALPQRLGSNIAAENIRRGKSVAFPQEKLEETETHRRREENSIGSNRRIKSSVELTNQTRRSSHLNSYITNLAKLGNSSFINKTRNTQTENSIMEKYLFNKNPEYIDEYKLLTPKQQDIIRRRFLTYSPAEISKMAKDDDLYSIFYSELINKFKK